MTDPDNADSATMDPASAQKEPAERPPASFRFSTPIFVGLAAGGILLVVFAVAVLRKGGRSLLPHIGGSGQVPSLGKGEEGAPSIISPLGTVPHGSLTLHWARVPGIDDYQAFIYDNRIQIIWRSEKVRADSIELPGAARDRMIPGPTYFWRVVGYHSDGREESSPTGQFILTP